VAWYLYIAVVGAGFAAGFINTLAGSGSLVTLPLLMFIGLPAVVANGTNRIAIFMQNIVAVSSFGQQKILDFKRGAMLAVPAVIGSLLGARIAVNLNEQAMRTAIGILMVIMLFVIWIRPKRWLVGRPEMQQGRLTALQIVIFFLIGVYGGFIQAGVGIFLLAGLVLGAGYDLVRANAVKVFIVFCYTPFALAVFFMNSQINWKVGIILGIGNMLGAWVASRMAVKRGAGFVRWLLIAVVIVSAAKLLGLLSLISSIF
jgi:uncharacterized membrane protein YfcA